MSEKEAILTELYELIDGQMEDLKGKLTVDIVEELARRKKRIVELLDRIGREGFTTQ